MESFKSRIQDILRTIVLNIFPREVPSEEALIAYGADQERQRNLSQYLYLACTVCGGAMTLHQDPQRPYEFIHTCLRCEQQAALAEDAKPPVISAPHGRFFLEQRSRFTNVVQTETIELPTVIGTTLDRFLVDQSTQDDDPDTITERREAIKPLHVR